MAILMKTGDTAPVVQVFLLDAENNPVDIAGATVKFIMATAATPRTTPVEAAAVNAQVGTGTDGSKGAVEYTWAPGDTAIPGEYVAEFEVTYADGSYQTFPTGKKGGTDADNYIGVTIIDDLGGTV